MLVHLPQFGPGEAMIIEQEMPFAHLKELVFGIALGPTVFAEDTEGYLKVAAHLYAQMGGHSVSPVRRIR